MDGLNSSGAILEAFPRRRGSESNIRLNLNQSEDSPPQFEEEGFVTSDFATKVPRFFDEAHQLSKRDANNLGAGELARNGEPKIAEQLQFTKQELERQKQVIRQEQMQKEHAKANAYFHQKFGLKEEKLVTCT